MNIKDRGDEILAKTYKFNVTTYIYWPRRIVQQDVESTKTRKHPPFRSLYDIITCICTHNIPLSYLQNERREEKWLTKVYHNFFQHDDNHITFGYFHLPGFFSNNQIVCESLVWLLIYYLPQTHKSDIILRLYFHVNNTESRSTHR